MTEFKTRRKDKQAFPVGGGKEYKKIDDYKPQSKKTDIKKFFESRKDNPYSLGAERITMHKTYARLTYSSSYDREQSIKKLREEGIPAKSMSKNMGSKAFMYRYELYVFHG